MSRQKPRLSEALRIGAQKCIQIDHAMFNGEDGADVLGAIYLGAIGEPKPHHCDWEMELYNRLYKAYPVLREPVRKGREDTLTHNLLDMNDRGDTFEEMATWLERKGL